MQEIITDFNPTSVENNEKFSPYFEIFFAFSIDKKETAGSG